MNSILWFFDLYSQSKHGGARAQAADGTEISNAVQWLIYGACLVGIFAGPFAIEAANGKYPTFMQLFGSWWHVFWSILFAFVLTASLFKTVLKATTPLVVKIGTALAVGIASSKLIPATLESLAKLL